MQLIAEHGWKLLTDYTFAPTTRIWHHRSAPFDPPLSLTQLHSDDERYRASSAGLHRPRMRTILSTAPVAPEPQKITTVSSSAPRAR